MEERLVAFQLGQLAPAERGAVEGHLLGCSGCLAAYFEVKRAMDGAEALDEAPRAEIRESLRRSYLDAHARYVRPLRYAAAGFAAAALVAFGLWLHSLHPLQQTTSSFSGQPVDTASPAAQSLNTL